MDYKKRAIVTGATSFIGIALIKELIIEGYAVKAVVRPGSSRYCVLRNECPNVDLIECDMEEMVNLNSLISKSEIGFVCDSFYHVGWNSDFENPRFNLEGQMKNVGYLISAMEMASIIGCNKFLAIGSQAECGLVEKPINSMTPNNPITAYAKAKCEGYRKCEELSDELGIELYWPRLLSAYGPYDRPNTLVMSCIDACINHKEIAISAAEQIWDYVYVDDVARALRLIVEKGKPKKKYSIASGLGRPLMEYIKEIADVYDSPDLMDGIGKRPYSDNEVMYLVGDVSELYKDTGMVFNTDFKSHLPIPLV